MSRGALYNALKAISPLRAAVRRVRSVRERSWVPVWVLTGQERSSGERLTFFFCGQIENRNYLAHLVFREGTVTARRRRMTPWSIQGLLARTFRAAAFVDAREGQGASVCCGCYIFKEWWLAGLEGLAAHRIGPDGQISDPVYVPAPSGEPMPARRATA